MNVALVVLFVLLLLAGLFFGGAWLLAWLLPLAFPALTFTYSNGMALMGLIMLLNTPNAVASIK